jgi:hypothetical protein
VQKEENPMRFRLVFFWLAGEVIWTISRGIGSCIPDIPNARELCVFSNVELHSRPKIYGSSVTSAEPQDRWFMLLEEKRTRICRLAEEDIRTWTGMKNAMKNRVQSFWARQMVGSR